MMRMTTSPRTRRRSSRNVSDYAPGATVPNPTTSLPRSTAAACYDHEHPGPNFEGRRGVVTDRQTHPTRVAAFRRLC